MEGMPRLLSLLLLAGSLLLMVCAALHPVLPLTGPADLALIGATARWHWGQRPSRSTVSSTR